MPPSVSLHRAGVDRPPAAGLFRRCRTRRRVGLSCGNGAAGPQRFLCSWQSGSQQVAIIVAAIIGYVLNTQMTPQTMADWGWRIPFFIGSLIVPFIFMIRRSLQETEAFLARKHHPTLPEIINSILSNWRIVLAGMLLVVMTTVSFYLITVYTPTFGKSVLKLTITDSLIVTFCVALDLFWLPVMGALSDRIGRRPILAASRS
jgi:MHS family citrate/tricarballylate:H+ symporter-like MFS transporter